MRIRTIKPSFWKSETMATLAKDYRLLAVALLNYADDEGYFYANEALIRGECFPFDEDSKSIRGGLQELSRIGYITLGTSAEGHRIGRIPNFLEHQRIDKATPSKIKEKTIDWDDSTKPPRKVAEPSPTEVEGNGSGIGSVAVAPLVDLPLIDGTTAPVTEEMVEEWARAFPAVEVLQEVREMRAWCLANPKNRKTRAGINKFVVGWLGRQQDKARANSGSKPAEPAWKGAT